MGRLNEQLDTAPTGFEDEKLGEDLCLGMVDQNEAIARPFPGHDIPT
jgi:hypothetical protein